MQRVNRLRRAVRAQCARERDWALRADDGAVVMAAALAVTGAGYALARRRTPVFEEKNRWPTQSAIDRPLVAGSILFGVGWGLVGLCPGPAIANLATLSTPVIVFIVAMALGTLAHDLWYARGAARGAPSLAPANADG